MSELISDFFNWMQALSPLWAYVAIIVVAYGENVLPPIPGDMIVVFGGYLAGIGMLNLAVVILLSTVGGALGFMTMYAVGYVIGDAVLDPDRLRWLPKRYIGKVEHWLKRWGYGLVAVNRFLSGLRSVISVTVGVTRMHAGKTAVLCTFSAAVWTTLIATAGYFIGENWPVIGEYLSNYGQVVLVLIALAILVQIGRVYARRRRRRVGGG
jgi:membrane protein DedA with SNARE-associated domain